MAKDNKVLHSKHAQTAIQKLRYRLRSTKVRAPLVWFRHRGLNTDDCFLASYQRSGSTWMRFLLCELLSNSTSDFRNVKLSIPDIRHHREGLRLLCAGKLIKTHEPYRRDYEKAIYVVRDPRDVAVSLYEYDRPTANFEEFLKWFVTGKASPHGNWHDHVTSWLDSPLAGNGGLFLLKYETLRAEPEDTMAAVLRFLDFPATPETIRTAIADNSFQRMRGKEDEARANGLEVSGETIRSRGRGVRKGLVGGWREVLNPQQVQLIEDHAGDLLARLGYACQEECIAERAQPEQLPRQDTVTGGSRPQFDEASAYRRARPQSAPTFPR